MDPIYSNEREFVSIILAPFKYFFFVGRPKSLELCQKNNDNDHDGHVFLTLVSERNMVYYLHMYYGVSQQKK